MTSRDLLKKLEKSGWICARINGSHHQLRNPTAPERGTLTVPHPKKELQVGLVNAILKQAGLK